jgi:hypothetical protein
MTAWASWTAKTIMLTACFAAAGGGLSTAALASTGGGAVTSGMGSVAGGNQVSVPITIPLNVCGNAVALLGIASAGCQGGAVARTSGYGIPGMVTGGSGSVLGGNQVNAPATAPVDACGNSVAVLGIAGAGCAGGSSTKPGSCGCRHGAEAVSSLLPVVWRPQDGLSSLASTSGAPIQMPASTLSAADDGGMSSASFFTLAGGVLLAGISALKMSSRGARRRPRRGVAA